MEQHNNSAILADFCFMTERVRQFLTANPGAFQGWVQIRVEHHVDGEEGLIDIPQEGNIGFSIEILDVSLDFFEQIAIVWGFFY